MGLWANPLAALLLSATAAASTPLAIAGDGSARIEWTQLISTAGDDWVNDLVPLKNGNVAAVGFLNRNDAGPSDWLALAAELRLNGSFVSQHRYGAGGGIDAFWSMREAAQGGRMFAGFTTRFGGGGIDGFTLLARGDGAVVREAAFGGGGYDRFTSVAQVTDGYVLLGHSQAEGAAKRRVFAVKTDLNGKKLWERIYDAPDSWGALYIESAPGGGFFIAGGTDQGGGDADMFAMKIDSQGRELWRHTAGTPGWDEINHGLVVRRDGSIVLVGYAHRRGEETNDLVAATLSPSGEVRFVETFGGAADDRAILARADASGRVWVVGQTASAGAGGTDLLLARLDASGGFEKAALTIGGPSDDNGTAVLPLADGSVMLAGYSRGLGGGAQDAFVVRISKPAFDKPHPAFRSELIQP